MNPVFNIAKREGNILKSLLYIFTDEVLRDFQEYVSEKFKIPSSLWTYKQQGLTLVKHRKPYVYYPEFCKRINQYAAQNNENAFCSKLDAKTINDFLNNFDPSASESWGIVTCPMGLSRIIFPLVLDDQKVGVFTLGKFMREGEKETIVSILDQQTNNVMLHCKCVGDIKGIREDLEKQIDFIPIKSNIAIDKIISETLSLMPLLQRQCVRLQQKTGANRIMDGFLFLESIDYTISDPHLSYEALWKRVSEILEQIINFFSLHSAGAYLTNPFDKLVLDLKAPVPVAPNRAAEIFLKSHDDLKWLIDQERGVIIPTDKEVSLSWINDHMDKVTSSDLAIVYAREVYVNVTLFLSFGFKPNSYLSDFEKLLLRISVNRLLRFISHVVSLLEIEYAMSLTGHKLRRTHGDIKGGLNSLQKYGFSTEGVGSEVANIIFHAHNSIISGLAQLDLITRNFHAYSHRIWVPTKNDDHQPNPINLINIMKDFEGIYGAALFESGKKLSYDFSGFETLNVDCNEEILKLLIWNIYDNAFQFSYNKTTIFTKVIKKDGAYKITVSNHGVGIPSDELKLVFTENFKGSFRDKNKETTGHGRGLFICKRCIGFLFREAEIVIDSEPNKSTSDDKKRWPGDHYITTVTITIPDKYIMEKAEDKNI